MLDTIYWLIAMFIFLLIELATISLATVWFAAGAAAAAVIATFTDNGYIQFTVFFIVSFATLFLFRPSIAKKFNKKTVATNVDSLIGRRVVVTEKVDNIASTGAATLNGNEWTARSASDNVTFEAGENATVSEITGVKLILTK